MRNIRLREKLKKNLNSDERRYGYLKHDINDYFSCIPLINDNQLRENEDTWQVYYQKAAYNEAIRSIATACPSLPFSVCKC